MPIYAFRCAACGHAKDLLMKVSDPAPTVCPACGAAAFTKQVTAAGFQLKGSGWYVTDFRDGKAGAEHGDKPGEKHGEKPADKGSENAAGADKADAGAPAKADSKADGKVQHQSDKAGPASAATASASAAAKPSAAPSDKA